LFRGARGAAEFRNTHFGTGRPVAELRSARFAAVTYVAELRCRLYQNQRTTAALRTAAGCLPAMTFRAFFRTHASFLKFNGLLLATIGVLFGLLFPVSWVAPLLLNDHARWAVYTLLLVSFPLLFFFGLFVNFSTALRVALRIKKADKALVWLVGAAGWLGVLWSLFMHIRNNSDQSG
jgi:hypothetical protein